MTYPAAFMWLFGDLIEWTHMAWGGTTVMDTLTAK